LLEALPEGLRMDTGIRYNHGAAYYRLGQALDTQAATAAGSPRAAADRRQACARYAQALPILQELLDRFKDLGATSIQPDMVRQAMKACGSAEPLAAATRQPR
jgi:hypothetical protein